jgi:predicted RNA-binding protein with PUA-like domain
MVACQAPFFQIFASRHPTRCFPLAHHLPFGSQCSPVAAPNHWLVKSEPASYSWKRLVKDGGTAWTGIRNYQSRNNLRAMRKGDRVLFYHSVTAKEIVGVATVARIAYPDPTAKTGDWAAVDLKPVRPLATPVTLVQIKKEEDLEDIPLLKNSRLSVMPLTEVEYDTILHLAQG